MKYVRCLVLTFLASVLFFPSFTSAATAVSTSNTNVVRNGLVGHWTFDGKNMTNATATDISGNGNNGTLVNMTTASGAVQGKIGQALKFNGTNQVITTNRIFSTSDASQAYTINAWIKTTDTDAVIVEQYAGANRLLFNVYTGGYLNWTKGGATVAVTSVAVNDNKWHMVTGIKSGSGAGQVQLYVDGVASGSSGTDNTAFDNIVTQLPGGGAGGGSYFNGSVDDVRIYNRALSPTEVQSLYKAGGGVLATAPLTNNGRPIVSNLYTQFTFDGKNMTNTVANNSGFAGNNGTLVNMTTKADAVPGKIGQALRFNGSNDYITIGTAEYNSYVNNYSYTGWVKYNSFASAGTVIGHGSRSFMYVNGSGQLSFHNYTSGNYDHSASEILQLGTWYHVAAVKNSSTGVSLYINGRLVSSSSTSLFTDNILAYGTDIASVGRYAWDAGDGGYMNGSLDDVRFYNKALTATEVQTIYKVAGDTAAGSSLTSNKVGINSGLVGHWTFDGKNMTNATATDMSGNGNSATLIGTTATSSAITGKLGQGMRLDGSDDRASVTHNVAFNAYPISYGGWFKTTYSNGVSRAAIISKYTGGSGDGWELDVLNGKILTFYFGTSGDVGGSLDFVSPGNVNDNKWHHCIIVIDATGGKMYLDGGLVATKAWASTPSATTSSSPLRMGEAQANGLLPASIDDLRVYNRALSGTEVYSLYKLGSQ